MKTPPPSPLEQQVYEAITKGLGEAIGQRLNAGYANNPLNSLIDQVVVSRTDAIRTMIEESLDGALFGDFRAALKDAVTHKLARIITAKMEGEIEKRANELRSSPEFRAKVTIAIESVIKAMSAT